MEIPSNDKLPILIEFWHEAPEFGNQVPVRFRIGDIDLLKSHRQDSSLVPNLPLLLPKFAALGMACLRLAKQTGRAALELDDYTHELLFHVKANEVSVYNTRYGTTATVGYEDLFKAWLAFAEDLRRIVTERNPDKASSPWWSLIYDAPEPQLAEILTRPSWFEEREGK